MQIQWKVGRRGAPKLCGEAQRTAPRGQELAEKQDDRKKRGWKGGRRNLFGGKAENGELCRSTQSFRAVVESFHAAAVIMKGGERSWISAAVSLSMTSIGPPHLGQSQS